MDEIFMRKAEEMQMTAAVMSDSEFGRELCALLARSGKYTSVLIIEKDYRRWGRNPDGIPVISMGKAIKAYHDREIDVIVIPSMEESMNEGMYAALREEGVHPEDILYAPVSLRGKADASVSVSLRESVDTSVPVCQEIMDDASARECMNRITVYDDRTELGTVEIHAADHCNLNCKNCSMFCGLIEGERFADYEETRKGVLKLREFFDHVKKFRIIGGEPLLNQELYRYIDLTREVFPYTDIRLITNGILVPQMSNRLKNSLREHDVTLIITQYPPMAAGMDDLHAFLEAEKIRHEITEPVKQFQKIYDLSGRQLAEASWRSCRWKRECATMYGSRLATCFVPFVLPVAGKAFDFPVAQTGIIDLEEDGLTRGEIRRRLDEPFSLCRFCTADSVMAEWGLADEYSKNDMRDWSI
ncbi:MAG: 4Fe-4S cluster-binding domain-containing protein [Clostridiales bacterium]|nr:4Fe-4S cluster-binding domain-containing protein [Clostridiales bacterium]